MQASRFASLDVGSNTVRLLIGNRLPGNDFRPLRVERIITRLGGNFSETGNLGEAAMVRTIDALRSFTDLLKRERVEKTFAVATGVLREAKNKKALLERVEQHTGLSLRLLSGTEEARLTLQGVLWSLKDKTLRRLIADVGGWSTEIIWLEGENPRQTFSLRLGAVALTERLLKNDPPSTSELESLENRVMESLREIRGKFKKEGEDPRNLHPHLVGTAGTATTLAAIDLGIKSYDPEKIKGHRIERSRLEKIYLQLCSLPIEERRKVPGLEKGREDLIIAGAAIFQSLLEVFDLTTLEVVDSGLLEGAFLEGIAQMRNGECGMRNSRTKIKSK